MSNDPMVNIVMITYNHEPFIRQAISSIVEQKTSFEYQLIIAEDKSSDHTRNICEELAKTHSDKILLLPECARLGMMRNLIQAFEACQGKYVAICEGDDYWSDSTKLQKQFDILENNLDISIVCHDTAILHRNGTQTTLVKPKHRLKTVYSQQEMCASVLPVYHTSSLFFRKFERLPSWVETCIVGDIPIFLLAVLKGDVYYLNEVMSVYRKHDTSISAMNNYSSRSHQQEIQTIYEHVLAECKGDLKPALIKGKKGRIAKFYFDRFSAQNDKWSVTFSLLPLVFIGHYIDLSFRDILWLLKARLTNKLDL